MLHVLEKFKKTHHCLKSKSLCSYAWLKSKSIRAATPENQKTLPKTETEDAQFVEASVVYLSD
jgi:hypothetical protein